MAQTTRMKSSSEWISVQEASALIGVSPATLRRWSDAGDIRTFTTPGGHRRFSRSAILGLLTTAPRRRPTLDSLGETPDRLIGVYRRYLAAAGAGAPWLRGLGRDDMESHREIGDRLTTALLRLIDATTPMERDEAMRMGADAADEYGRMAARRDLGLQQVIEIFLQLRLPFVNELATMARRRGLTTAEATAVLERAAEGLDRSLVGLVQGYSRTSVVSTSAEGLTP